eukprot:comp21136_c0_seq1/m.44740 comp21136_c0_seq1/g.44740  ORF comp21136_c0_seq1/g.44740 comp21136_c0_seq1/m.44740 type:complete len:401 (+) comp21136_c0_seq1:374-1576(+)
MGALECRGVVLRRKQIEPNRRQARNGTHKARVGLRKSPVDKGRDWEVERGIGQKLLAGQNHRGADGCHEHAHAHQCLLHGPVARVPWHAARIHNVGNASVLLVRCLVVVFDIQDAMRVFAVNVDHHIAQKRHLHIVVVCNTELIGDKVKVKELPPLARECGTTRRTGDARAAVGGRESDVEKILGVLCNTDARARSESCDCIVGDLEHFPSVDNVDIRVPARHARLAAEPHTYGGVPAESADMVLLREHHNEIRDVLLHLRRVVVWARSPRGLGLLALVKVDARAGVARESVQSVQNIVDIHVVEHNVHDDAEAERVGGLDKALQRLVPAKAWVNRKRSTRVVSPAVWLAWECCGGQDLDSVEIEPLDVLEQRNCRVKGAHGPARALRKRANVHFVDRGL